MPTLATDPDAVAAALVAVLTPGGVPVGTLGAVVRRTPDAPYGGATPILLIRPVQDMHDWVTAGAKRDVGHLELLYRDAPLAQQQAADGSVTQTTVEDRLWANRRAIVTQLDAHRSLDGAITALGPYESTYNPDGVEVTWDNGPWIGMSLVVQYTGPKVNMPPTGA
jgi:hypothetical protein